MNVRNTISDSVVFEALFGAVYLKCFGHSLIKVPSESDCRYLSNRIENATGLVIGWKSVKNYCIGLLDNTKEAVRPNPSIPTLDTLSRYVLEVPLTNEIERKELKEPYIHWYRFRENFLRERAQENKQRKWTINKKTLALLLLVLTLFLIFFSLNGKDDLSFIDDFKDLSEQEMKRKGWNVLNKNHAHWEKRSGVPGHLQLYTLRGDNWYYENKSPRIENLVYRRVPNENFTSEVHLSDFIPEGNWQQAGLLIMEDTLFQGKSIRVSIAYNDFFGGRDLPGEILVQGISSMGNTYKNSEEFIHLPLFKNDDTPNEIIRENLKYSALKVEKTNDKYRFLYAASPFHNFSFKEIDEYTFDMEPKFIGIFAIKGFNDSTKTIPVLTSYFRIEENKD